MLREMKSRDPAEWLIVHLRDLISRVVRRGRNLDSALDARLTCHSLLGEGEKRRGGEVTADSVGLKILLSWQALSESEILITRAGR